MANTPNVELEAAKFLHKLIQESKDEPTKLATKLYVILQHMRSSGKENSMPYQVISRAMETVIKQHNLDIEALMSSRLPVAAGAQVGDSSSSQLAGSSQRVGVANNAKASLPMNEVGRPDGHASSRGQVGPSSGGQDIYRGKASHTSVSTNVHGATPGVSGSYPAIDSGISNPMHFGSSSYENHGFAPKMQNEKITESYSATPSFDLSASKSTAGKAVDHEGGTNTIANKAIQGGVVSNATETSMLKSVAPRETGKSPTSSVPFKEQQLRQLRAQCLVFLAFRNGLMPKKLHLEIALGNILPKDDVLRREQSVNDPSSLPEVTRPFGRVDTARETDRMTPGSSSAGILAETNPSKGAENSNVMDDRSGPPTGQFENVEDGKHHFTTKKPEAEETTESQSSASRGLQPDSNTRGLAVSYNRNDLRNTGQLNGTSNQASFSMGTGHARKDNFHNQSPAECNFQASRFAESNLPSFQSREQWTPISGVDGQNPSAMPVKDTDTMMNNLSQVQESDPEEEDNSISTGRPPSPKYTTVDKWILDQQKRKILTEQKWARKQQKTEKKIAACFDKLKESVSSSEDIFAKTKSVIELKKLQLLELQRRLRSDILNDFFKPIATDMDRLKSIKKHRIGRKSKQLERYEQRMKEERQKRFRERQKEFFGEIEVHRERLEDIFKMRRERWKGFNRYVREFHKRKERIHREKIDRIQREKINLLKINDVEGYLRMVQDAKSDRVKQLLKETEKYLSKLGAKLQDAKVMTRRFETEMDESRSTGFVEKTETTEDEDDTDQAKHYLESNEKYYMMAHSIKENITEQPACLVGGKLREYQMNGLRWLVSLYNNHLNGILADEMGLGKTVQVISLICYLMENKNDRGPFLVVVPSSVLPGWESEINFWAPSIQKIVYSGPPEERRRLFKEQIVSQKFNVLLTTYEYLMNKHDRPKLSKVHWHYIIIDEGHRIKNASCKLNADLKHYRSNHRLLLTGTPLQNNLEELWALLNFLLPNIFNSSEDFSQWFNKPFESNGDNSPDEALLSEEENLLIINRLHQVLRPFVLRRLKHKVENQLPEKIERLVRCEASAYQKLLMKRVEENLGAFGTSKARSVHNSVMELRNICNHPYLSQIHVEEVHDLIPKHYLPNIVRLCGKLEMLDRLLPKLKATDHRVLLFSTMTRLLDVMEDYLYWKQYKYLRLDGHTSGGERGALIDQFNQPTSPYFIFLLSIRAGGVGVNLQAADTVIIFDTDWNPQVDLQAQARAHRIGQKKDVLVLRLETVQTVEEQVRAAAEHKLGVANQSITAGFFDNNTSAEDRREYLESLLRECKKEEAAPVLDDDALNDLIARSESEIDIFESVDKRRREEEMAAWKQLITEKGAESSPLPPRLLTDDDLRAFYEVMKITEAPHPGVASTAGVKRKGEYLGGLDTQQYGRGKRAREVRSYEEQWTEEEFEKMCQVDSSGSPNYKDPNTEKKLASVTSGSVVATGEKLEPALPQPHLQPPFEPTGQQIKEVTPPSKRGRGRPKRTVTAVNIPAPVAPAPVAPAPVAPAPVAPAPVALAALSGVSKIEAGSSENTSSHTMLHGPDSFPSNTPRRSITGNINQVGVSAAPSPQSSSLPSVGPASQSTHLSTPVRGRGRGRKAQTGEAARRRGKRQNLVLQDVPVTSMSPESEKPEIEKQGVVIPSSSTASDPISVSCSATLGEASKEPNAVAPIPVLQSSSVTEKVNVGAQQKSNLSSSVVPDPESFPGFPAVIGTGKEDHGIRIAPASELSTSLPSVIPASQTILSQSEPKQGRGRGRKPQVGGEAACRRGKRQEPATPIVISGSADQDLKSIEPPQKRSRVSAGRRVSARNKQDNEPQILTPSIQWDTAQTTSDPAIGHVHNGEQENESQEKRNDAKSDTSRGGTIPAVEHVSVAAAEHDIAVMKDIPHESPLSEIKKDASSRSENIDSQATPPSSINEVSKGPSLCGETSSAVSSESTAPNSDIKNGENGSQPRQKGREKDPQQLTDAIKSADPGTGKISDVDVENHTTATKEMKCQIVLPETAMKESLGGESRGTPNLPSSSKTCIEDVKGQLLDDSHTSASIVGSEVPLEKVADEMPEIQVRKENGENGENAVLQDKVADEMHETQARKGSGEKNVRVDNATDDISESQARNNDARKEGQMHNPLVDRSSGVLALSAPTSHLSLVQSDSNMGKLRDQEKEDRALAEVLVSNLPTMDAAPTSINNALNNSGDLSAKEERLHQESEDPASCDVSGSNMDIPASVDTCSNVDIPASVDTCCGDVKDHTLDDTSASTLRSSDIADTTTDKMCEGQANKEDMEKEGLMQNTCVNETSDMLPPSEPISDLSLVQADNHSGKLQDQEKENPALTEVLVSSFPTSETAPPSTDIALNNSGDLSVKEDISDQDSKVSAPCDAPRLNSDLLALTETCSGDVKDQTLDDTTASALKSSAIVDSITNEMCKGQDNKDDVEKEGQVQNPPTDETSALLAPSAPASDLSLLQAESHSEKLEDREMEGTNLPTTDDAPPNSNIALDNSFGDLSGKEDRIDQVSKNPAQCDVSGLNSDLPASIDTCCGNAKDQALDETSASTFRSSNMVDGTTEETHEAQADKGDMEKEGLMQNAVVGETSDMLAPSEPASDLSSVPADSPSRKLEAQEKEDPALTEVLVSSVPTSETAPSNIDIALNDPEDLSVRVDQESKDSAPCDVPGLNSHLPTSVETGSQDVQDRSLDNNSASTLRSAATVDSTIDEMCEGQASKEVVENKGQLQSPSVDKTSVLSAPSPHASDSSLIPAESHSGKLKDHQKEPPALSEVLVSDLPITDSALPSINIALDNSGNVSEKEDRVNQESKEPTPCDVPGLDDDLPASVETCWGDVKDQPLDDNSESALRSSATVDSSTDALCKGQANKEDMEKEGQMQNTVVESALLAPIAPASDLLSVAADSHLGKMEDQEKEDPALTEVLVPSLPTMETAPPITEIPLNNSEDPSAKEGTIDQESKNSAPCDAPGLRLDLPASFETCLGDVKAQSLDDTSAPGKSAATIDSSTDKKCGSLASEEEGEKERHEQNPLVDETPSMLAPGTPASDSLLVQFDSHSEKPEDREKNDTAVNEDLSSSSPTMGTSPASVEIAVNSSGDPSGKEDRTDEESKDSSPCHIPELKLDLPVSIQSCTEDVKDQTRDGSHASTSTVSSVCGVDSTTTESCKGQAGEEDGGKVGEVKESAEALACDLLTVGDHSHCGESEEEEKKDPARSEVLDSSTLPITEPANPSDGIAPNNSDSLPEEQNRTDKEHRDSALDISDVAVNESSQKNLLSTSPTSRPEASSLGSPENVSAKEVEEEKNRTPGVDGCVNSKSEVTEIDNSCGEGGDPPTL